MPTASFETISALAASVLGAPPGAAPLAELVPSILSAIHANPSLLTASSRPCIEAILTTAMCSGSPLIYSFIYDTPSTTTNETNLPPEYHPSHKGKPCGHVFTRGEGVYRCKTCALDDTCVFCTRCFRASSHDGHDTSFSVAVQSGGCCDCGDPEAWKLPVHCKYHSLDTTESADGSIAAGNVAAHLEPIPNHIVAGIRSTVSTILEYVVATFSKSPQSVLQVPTMDDILSQYPRDPATSDAAPTLYSLILWNDETHSYAEVIDQLMDAIDCTEDDARSIADTVDKTGRTIIVVSDHLPRIMTSARILNRISLGVSIRPVTETYQEELACLCMRWLKNLCRDVKGFQTMSDIRYDSVAKTVREIICDELLAPLTTNLGANAIQSPTLNSIMSGALTPAPSRPRLDHLFILDSRLWKSLRTIHRELYISTLIVSGDHYKRNMALRFTHSYLDILNTFVYSDREPDISIITFSVQLFTVPSIATYIVTTTPIISVLVSFLKAFYLSDVEGMGYDTGALFYASIARAVGERGTVYPALTCDGDNMKRRHVWPVFNDLRYLLHAYRIGMTQSTSAPASTIPGSSLIAQSCVVATSVDNIPIITRILDLLMTWHGMHPHRRSIYTHIDYETNTWVTAFNHSLHTSRLIRHFIDCYFNDTFTTDLDTHVDTHTIVSIVNAVSESRDVLLRYTVTHHAQATSRIRHAQSSVRGTSHHHTTPITGFHTIQPVNGVQIRVPDYRVSVQDVSVHLPACWMYSGLMKRVARVLVTIRDEDKKHNIVSQVFGLMASTPTYPHDALPSTDTDTDTSRVLTVSEMMTTITPHERYTLIFDYPLRSIVFVSQIRCNMWTRNGSTTMQSQALHYKHHSLRDCYDRDMFMVQCGVCVVGVDTILGMILDRFGLTAWIRGLVTVSDNPVYQDTKQLVTSVHDMLWCVVTIVTERTWCTGASTRHELEREMMHVLASCVNGIGYSDLMKRISEDVLDRASNTTATTASTQHDLFDTILTEISTRKHSTPSTVPIYTTTPETTTYHLKPDLYTRIDPYYHHYTRNDRDTVLDLLKSRYKDTVYRVPLIPIPHDTGYAVLDTVVHSTVYMGMVVTGLVWMTCVGTSDGVMDDGVMGLCLRMLMIGLDVMDMTAPQTSSTAIDTTDAVSTTGFIHNLVYGEYTVPNPTSSISTSTVTVRPIQYILHLIDRCSISSDLRDNEPVLRCIIDRLMRLCDVYGYKKIRDDVMALCTEWKGMYGTPVTTNPIIKPSAPTASEDKVDEEKGTIDVDKKKEEARLRRQRIMQQFQKAQQSFMETNTDYMDMDENPSTPLDTNQHDAGHDDGHDNVKWTEFPNDACIVCQEPTTTPSSQTTTSTSVSNKLYGILCYASQTPVRRVLDYRDTGMIDRMVHPYPTSMDGYGEDKRPDVYPIRQSRFTIPDDTDANTNVPGLPDPCPLKHRSINGVTLTTCGHLMHIQCYVTYIQQQRSWVSITPAYDDYREFVCPLCKGVVNMVLPVIWGSKCETTVAGAGDCVMQSMDKWLNGQLSGHPFQPDPIQNITNSQQHIPSDTVSPLTLYYRDFMTQMYNPSSTMAYPSAITYTGKDVTQYPLDTGISYIVSDCIRKVYDDYTCSVVRRIIEIGKDGMDDDEDRDDRVTEWTPFFGVEKGDTFWEMEDVVRMWDVYVMVVCHAEIYAREYGLMDKKGVLANVSGQMRTSLRVVGESAYQMGMIVGRMGVEGMKKMFEGYKKKILGQEDEEGVCKMSLFAKDGFTHLVYLSMCVIGINSGGPEARDPAGNESMDRDANQNEMVESDVEMADENKKNMDGEVFMWIRLMYVYEMVRVIISVAESVVQYGDGLYKGEGVLKSVYASVVEWRKRRNVVCDGMEELKEVVQEEDERMVGLNALIKTVLNRMKLDQESRIVVEGVVKGSLIRSMFEKVGLVFLRRAVLLLYGRYGIEYNFEENAFGQRDFGHDSELDRLSKLIGVMNVDGIVCDGLSDQMSIVMDGWMNDYQKGTSKLEISERISFETLPEKQEDLIESMSGVACTGCLSVPVESVVCLSCGRLLCGMSFCCSVDGVGECSCHVMECVGMGVGIYLVVREGRLILLRGGIGVDVGGIYVDERGESSGHVIRRSRLRRGLLERLCKGILREGVSEVVRRGVGRWETF